MQKIEVHIALLIELFYGLAITEGLAKAIPDLLDGVHPWRIIFTVVALFIGLGDWLAYHLIIASTPYRGLFRLMLDMFFPILIFAMFAAAGHPVLDTVAVAVYFIFGLIYFFALRRERPQRPLSWGFFFVLLFAATIVVSGFLIDLFYQLPIRTVSEWSVVVAASVWVTVTLGLVKGELRMSRVGGPEVGERHAFGRGSSHSASREAISCVLGALIVAATLKSSRATQRPDADA